MTTAMGWFMSKEALQYWEVWDPRPAATGILIARCQVDATDSVILHAAPDVATVEVSDVRGTRVAYGAERQRTAQTPMCRFGATATRSRARTSGPTSKTSGVSSCCRAEKRASSRAGGTQTTGWSGAGRSSSTTHRRGREPRLTLDRRWPEHTAIGTSPVETAE
jgi:hypothetical protein